MWNVQIQHNHEGDEYFKGGEVVCDLEVEEGEHGYGGHDLEDVEPEGAAVDSEVDEDVVWGLLFHGIPILLKLL